MIGSHFIKGWARTQINVTLSSAEAELVAMAQQGVIQADQQRGRLGCSSFGIACHLRLLSVLRTFSSHSLS